mmetsp:Transcript_67114/g.112354  ORF Transcript_67114/g.112354 Transcript_67114/m.112354 type:complete len:99 (-) Transcript_67114:212-508(-)
MDYRMYHHMETLDAVVQIKSTLLKNFPAHPPSVELGERVFAPSSDKTVTVVVLCTPFPEGCLFRFGIGDHTMGTSRKSPIQQSSLSFFVLFDFWATFL